ncbi:c-type cytochrome [Jiella marina]|uniref:c-type cytochrome n=1 Tax=Jiella sp. LLJ827 TaxID=2917712 RepID=UPI0021013D15|nr:cytochrome c [Jiella sp. LLJ827]MCQ0989729.1 cytochrome c [Jiella sp. LLJ827]
MIIRLFANAILVASLTGAGAQAADLAAGKEKAGQCVPCHGLDGVAKAPDAPNLAGDSMFYLTEQLKAFRGGQRQHQQMSIIASGLSDEDIADLAAWYSAIEVSVTLPDVQ